MLQEGGRFPGPESGLLSNISKWIVKEMHTLTKQKTVLVPKWRAGGWGNPGGLLCHVAHCLRFYGDGVSFQVVSDQSSCLVCIDLTQGPSWWHMHCSVMMDTGAKGSGRLVGHIMGWCLLPPSSPSCILPVSFSTVLLIGTSCCETTHARGYHHAWPRQVVSGNGSLTTISAFVIAQIAASISWDFIHIFLIAL